MLVAQQWYDLGLHWFAWQAFSDAVQESIWQ
jgi:hypothetical protein